MCQGQKSRLEGKEGKRRRWEEKQENEAGNGVGKRTRKSEQVVIRGKEGEGTWKGEKGGVGSVGVGRARKKVKGPGMMIRKV